MRKYIALFLVVITVAATSFSSYASGGAFLIMDGRTFAVLEGENFDSQLPMASTTKIMTALVVLENSELSAKVRIPKDAVGIEGSSLYIKEGEEYSVEELLYGLMLRSANDCAVALAWHCGQKNIDDFIEMMNQKAVSMGLKDTQFKNPHGLTAQGHYTTAKELAIIMAAAMKNEDFRKITSTKQYTIRGQVITNHNKLLSTYVGCIGGKTGYTEAAGRCLVSVAQRRGSSLICVTLGRGNDWDLHSDAYDRWFEKLHEVTLAEKGEFSIDLPIAGGGRVRAVNCNKATAQMFEYSGEAETRVLAGPFVYGNKMVGDAVGSVEFWYQNVKIGESPLVLTAPIEVEVKKELFITRIIRFFRRLFLKKD